MTVAELAEWLDEDEFARVWTLQQGVAERDTKLMWSVQETQREPELFRTKAEAEKRLGERKEELESAGLTVDGSKSRGFYIYGLGESYEGAVMLYGRRKTPQKGD